MAFQTAANYGSLPNGVFSPTIYSKKVQKQFRKDSVVEAITNSDYFGEIKAFGDSVKVIKEPEVTVSAYARGTQLTPQDLEDSDFTLTIDRSNYFMFGIDDIEKQQSHVGWMDLAANRAAYKMKDVFDADILGYMSGYEKNSSGVWVARTAPVGTVANADAGVDELLSANKLTAATWGGSASDSIAVGVAGTYVVTPLGLLNRINRLMDINNVPKDGRYVVLDPVFIEILMDENSKFINNDYNANQNAGGQLTNGKLVHGKIRGFEIYESNNLPYIGTGPGTADVNGSASHYGVIVAGQKQAVATAQQLEKTETYRDPYSFRDITRGMHLYGRKILRSEALIRAIYNINV